MRTAFNYAVKLDLLERNVFNKIELPKYTEKERRAVTLDEYHQMVNFCNTDDWRFMMIAIELAVSCCLRLGEVTGLQWDDVHLEGEHPYIEINKTLVRESRSMIAASSVTNPFFRFPTDTESTTQLILKQPKTTSSIRRIFLPKQEIKVLKTWKQEQEAHKELLGDLYHDFNLVICQQNGDPADSNLVDKRLKKMCKALGIEGISFHCFRHTAASLKLKLSGGNYKAVQADSGHATTQMLLDRYAHVFEEDRIENAQKVGDVLFSKEVDKPASIDDQVTALLGNKELLARLLEKLQTEGGENESCTKTAKSCTTV